MEATDELAEAARGLYSEFVNTGAAALSGEYKVFVPPALVQTEAK